MRKMLSLIACLILAGGAPLLAGWDEGVAAFKAKDYPKAAQEFQEVVKQSPDSYQGYYMLGLTLAQLNKHQDALSNLRKAYDLNPNDLTIKLALGQAYFKVRRYGDVAKLLATIDGASLAKNQQQAFYQMRAQAKLKSDDERGALKDLEALVRLKPNDAKLRYLYGTTALSVGDERTALAAVAKAVELAPDDEEIRRTYVNMLVRKGRVSRDKNAKKQAYSQAAEQAKALVAINPSYDNLMLKVSAELGAGLYQQAAATGEQALAKNKGDWLAHFYVGQALSSQQRYAESEPYLNQAKSLAKNPNDLKMVWRQLGFVYEKQKKYSESIEAYENAGDQTAAARVKENAETARYNQQVEEENRRIKEMEEEAKRLEEELKKLEGGGGF